MPLADGGCKYCGECSYPNDPCRFPDQRVSSISCYGILMEEYMKAQNIDFTFEKDSVTLYGLIMYNEP
jgi:predicted metal-binding protein